jgi:hypothetical protein
MAGALVGGAGSITFTVGGASFMAGGFSFGCMFMTLASECEDAVTFEGWGSIKLEMEGDSLARFVDLGGGGASGGGVDTLGVL